MKELPLVALCGYVAYDLEHARHVHVIDLLEEILDSLLGATRILLADSIVHLQALNLIGGITRYALDRLG